MGVLNDNIDDAYREVVVTVYFGVWLGLDGFILRNRTCTSPWPSGRDRDPIIKYLWSVCLSLPLSLRICEILIINELIS